CIALMLDFSTNSLGRHPSGVAYRSAQRRMFENLDAQDWAVINADDPSVLELARRGRARTRLFSKDRSLPAGTVIDAGWIVDRHDDRSDRLVPLSAIHLLGPHLVKDRKSTRLNSSHQL